MRRSQCDAALARCERAETPRAGFEEGLKSVVRRAVAMAASEQYLRLAIGFASIACTSRLLTPGEVGLAVIGTAIMAIALGLREFAAAEFLIQRREVLRQDVRTSFTILFLLTALIASAMFLLAPWFGVLYGEAKLARFIRVAAFAGLIEALALPITGLLKRDMAFGTLAFINTTSAIAMSGATVLLALLGFSYMSFAWGAVVGAATTSVLAFRFGPDLWILRPTLASWRSVLSFGSYNGVSFVINRTYEALPQLVLGHLLSHSAVGLYNRATLASDIPDKIVLSSVMSVAFPALAAEIRRGGDLKEPYLKALALITVFYWPGQVLLVLLAYPIILLLMGHQWLGVVPVLQIMAIATFAWFPVVLTSPVLLAIGANRDRVLADLVGRSVSAVLLCSAAWFGILAMAASKLVTLPFQMALSFYFVRRHVPFRWSELSLALWKSTVATASSAVGPIVVVTLSDSGFELSTAATVVAVLLSGIGWLAGVVMTRHPVLPEIMNAVYAIAATSVGQRSRRLRDRILAVASSAGAVR